MMRSRSWALNASSRSLSLRTATGTVEARPHNLYFSGGFFGVYLEP
jgi:hypothetical protein